MRVGCMSKILLLFLLCAQLFVFSAPAEAKGVRIAVLDWKIYSDADAGNLKENLSLMISKGLGPDKGLIVIDPDTAKNALAGIPISDAENLAAKAKEALNADYVLFGSVSMMGQFVSMDARLLDTRTGDTTPLFSTAKGKDSATKLADGLSRDVLKKLVAERATIALNGQAPEKTPVTQPAKQIEKNPETTAPMEQPKPLAAMPLTSVNSGKIVFRGIDIDGLILGMTAADIDGDGKKELFLLKKRSVIVARFEDGALNVIKEIKSASGADNISICSIDSDSDGSVEVYVSAIRDGKPHSSAIEFKDNAFNITMDSINWVLRIFNVNSRATLAGQGVRETDGFFGPIKLLRKQGLKIVPEGDFIKDAPPFGDIYRIEPVNVKGVATGFLVLDQRGYLRLYGREDDGKWGLKWMSADFFGGTLNHAELGDSSAGTAPRLVPIEGRFFGHANQALIKRNIPGGLGRLAEKPLSFKTGSIISLSWDDTMKAMTKKGSTTDIQGYVSDFFMDDIDNNGKNVLVIAVSEEKGGLFGDLKSYILLMELSL